MPEKSDLFIFDLFGPVTVITDDLIVYQGDIERCDESRKQHDGGYFHPLEVTIAGDVEVEIEPRFLNIALACTPLLLVPSGTTVFTVPLFDVFPSLGTARINVAQIISVSAFNGICTVTGMVAE